MPIFIDNKRVQLIYKGETPIEEIHAQNATIWTPKADFATASWAEIKKWIEKGTWKEQNWSEGDVHTIHMKDDHILTARILAIYDGREEKATYKGQIDRDENNAKPHMVLELVTCLPDSYPINSEPEVENTPQSWGTSNLYKLMSPGGEIYDNLPNELQSMIIPVMKKSGISGKIQNSSPEITKSYLFPLSIREYVAKNNITSEINNSEGSQYQYYINHPGHVVKKEYAGDKNIVYYTRSAMQAENELYEYFWAIGGANNYATYPSYISLGTSFAFCI